MPIFSRTEDSLPPEKPKDLKFIEKSEIETRILKLAKSFEEINLRQLKWDRTFSELGLDSLN